MLNQPHELAANATTLYVTDVDYDDPGEAPDIIAVPLAAVPQRSSLGSNAPDRALLSPGNVCFGCLAETLIATSITCPAMGVLGRPIYGRRSGMILQSLNSQPIRNGSNRL